MIIASLSIISLISDKASAAPPDISDIHFNPKYPQVGDKINVTGKVVDPLGLQTVQIFYCLPGGSCVFEDMDGPDANDIYNKTLNMFPPPATSMYFYIGAMNNNSEYNESAHYYIQYAYNITATMISDRSEAYPGQSFNLTVDAYYSDNTSAPCEYCDVDIVLVGTTQHWTGTMDDLGNFTIELTAPATVDSYVYNVTVTNRSLTAYSETTLLVLTEPLPDLVVMAAGITYTPLNPEEGDNVTANITVRNLGTLPATFRVLVTLDGSTVLKNVSITVGAGNSTFILVSWDALLGSQTLLVVLDSGNFVREVSESNNQAYVTVTGQGKVVDMEPNYLWLIVGGIMIIFIVLVLIVFLLRRKKPEQPME